MAKLHQKVLISKFFRSFLFSANKKTSLTDKAKEVFVYMSIVIQFGME